MLKVWDATAADPKLHYPFEIAASKTKIYMVLQLVNGGELFDGILWLLVVCALTSLSVGVAVSKPVGFPDHPHRGFETVTYMLEGAFTHQDFAGHKGTIRTRDVRWMTVGRGIMHSEMPAEDGVHKGLQLWINLSSKYKMIESRY
ncbi:Pirin-like protein [Zea mays]|uniref:Pirin-like protein n=1 Tax=Zea mays TaxID=4577 RepID=A0A3L6ENK5_MAIZE|nr:Pirin-like protein [Zea mays]